ncbi:MAG: HD domain-containing protein [Polyangiaceae bacterium]|nr:HD domain-containing protein [Polyangiaceae bacterium]
MLSPSFDRAAQFAVDKHRAQLRKGSGAPYVTHLFSVCALIGERGGDEEQMIAGLLHDSIEDQGVTRAELEALFGPRVARIVEACTDAHEVPKPPWKPRKVAHLAALRREPADVKLVSACDKLHNARSIARDLADPAVGAAIWGRFSAPREETLWYYRALVDALGDGFSHPVISELDGVVVALERA